MDQEIDQPAMHRTPLTVLLLLQTITTWCQGLSGTYTIGGSGPDYATIGSAVDDLILYGVSGPVLMEIADGTYTEQISIPPISGSSPSNTITFRSTSLDSSAVLLTFTPSSPATNHIVRIDGASHVTFSHLGFHAQGNYGTCIAVRNGSSFTRFLNNSFSGSYGSPSSNKHLVILDANTGNMALSDIEFRNNRFGEGARQIFVLGTSATQAVNNTIITENVFDGPSGTSVFVEWTNGLEVDGNLFLGPKAGSPLLIGMQNCNGPTRISGNRAEITTQINSGTILSLEMINGTVLDPVRIFNNAFAVTSTAVVQGVFPRYCSHVELLHNSFHILTPSPITKGIAFQQFNVQFIIKNNIFSLPQGGFIFYNDSQQDLSQIISDHNGIDCPTNKPVFMLGDTLSWSQWRSIHQEDLNSVRANPHFVSDSDLHIDNSGPYNGSGTPIPSVLLDMDGEARDPVLPDIGADEFDLDPGTFRDLELIRIWSPDSTICSAPSTIKFQIANHSIFPINDLVVEWWIFNARQDSLQVFQTIPALDTVLLDLGSFSFVSNTVYKIQGRLSLPNGAFDHNELNDRAQVTYSHLQNATIQTLARPACNDTIFLAVRDIPAVDVLWSTGSTEDRIQVTAPGTYSVTVTNGQGCTAQDSITIP